jgi:hypothetical protein
MGANLYLGLFLLRNPGRGDAMKEFSKSPLWPLTFVCAALLIGCRAREHPPALTIPVSGSGVPVGFRDISNLPGTVFQVRYTPATVRIDLPAVQKSLTSVSDDGRVLVFDSDDARLHQLKEGSVLFLEHLGVRRVDAVNIQGSQVAVLTDTASLPDLVQDGTIQFKVPVDFSQLAARSLVTHNRQPDPLENIVHWFSPPVAYASAPELKYSAKVKAETDGWEFELEGEPEGGGLALTLTAAKKKLAGLTATVNVKGKLENVNTTFRAVMSSGKLQEFAYMTPMSGTVDVDWSVLTMAPGSGIGESRLKLPPFAKDVFDIYGIPFLFKVDEALIFKPGFAGKKDVADGNFHVVYTGSGGLTIHGSQSAPEGKMEGQPQNGKTTAESLAAHGVVIAINAPKVSVSVGTESLKEALKQAVPAGISDKVAELLEKGPFGGLIKSPKENFFKTEGGAFLQLVTEFDYAGSGPLSIVPCSMTHLNFYAQAGADATLLGQTAESPKLNLNEVKITKREPDIDACGAK